MSNRVTNAQIMEAIVGLNSRMDSFESRLDKVESARAAKKATSSKKTKAPAKKTVSNSEEFDRDLYEKTAKKLGVFHEGKVTATVKDGKVVYSRKENRQRVYKAMGYTPAK